ncbi:MAG TPA: HAD family hydrolase [Clostridia bacterium]|nr:HAD family hydrolase [Clostridia bacterium]
MTTAKNRTSRVAIFDLDGTILNTLPSLVKSCNETLTSLGLPPFNEEEVKKFLGAGQGVLIERMMAASGVYDPSVIDQARRTFKALFPKLSTYQVKPFEGIPAMLDEVAAMGFKLAVLTNKNDQVTPAVIASSFPPGLFSIVRGARRFVPLKPDPRSTLRILRILKANPVDSFFIGDSDIDILTGRAAGMRTIAVTWGFRSRQELEALAPDLLAETPQAIVDYIARVDH